MNLRFWNREVTPETIKGQHHQELLMQRLYTIIVILVYPIYGYVNTFVEVPQIEGLAYFQQRLAYSATASVVFTLSFLNDRVRRNYSTWMVIFCYILMCHLMYIGVTNGFDFQHSLGVLMTVMATGFSMVNLRQMNWYLLFIAAMSSLSIYISRFTVTPPANLIMVFLLIIGFTAIVLNTKFRLQRVLQESHSNITALIENTNDIIWSIDREFCYVAFNRAFMSHISHLTGKIPKVGEKTLVDYLDEDIAKKLMGSYIQTMKGDSLSAEQRFVINGEFRYFTVSSNPIRLPNGSIIGATMFGHDITMAKRAAKEIEEQKQLLEENQREILDSINYAERIQGSLLASTSLLNAHLPEHFVYFKPKDVVSGDFYWATALPNGEFALLTADSTGHGVPGAIMSILNISCVEKAIEVEQLLKPAEILNHTRRKIIETLKKDGSKEGGKDGMDCSLVNFNLKDGRLTYSAANNPVWLVREGQLMEFAPDKMPVGKHDHDTVFFKQHEIALQKGDMVYTFTDGLPDQFGGERGRKFMYKQLKELLMNLSTHSVKEQKTRVDQTFMNWKGTNDQVDDVLLIGVRV